MAAAQGFGPILTLLNKQTAENKAKPKEGTPTKTPTIAETQAETKTYLDTIGAQQKTQADSYLALLQQQTASYEQQSASQAAGLNFLISSITSQSETQVKNYEKMLARVTDQQNSQMASLRGIYDTQNQQSESVIASLQTTIEKLSRPTKPPTIDVDTSPAVVGMNQAATQSRKRQRLGTQGGVKSPRQTGALGLAIGT